MGIRLVESFHLENSFVRHLAVNSFWKILLFPLVIFVCSASKLFRFLMLK